MRITDDVFELQLGTTLTTTDFQIPGATIHRGKVRDSYAWITPENTRQRAIVCTDRISAFDVVLGTIPFKGQVLNQMAAWWFRATADLVPNHLVGVPDPNVKARDVAGP